MHRALFIAVVAATVAPLPAQGHIRWPWPASTDVTAQLIHHDAGTHRLYLPGWTTIAAPGPEDPGSTGGEGAGLEVPGSKVRDVSGAGLVEENTAKTLEEMVVFPFVPEDNVVQGLVPGSSSFVWHGVQANPVGVVPAFQPGALMFELDSGSPLHDLLPSLVNARAFVAETDAQGFRTGQLVYTVTAAQVVPARVLYYKFESGGGAEAINYGGFPGVTRLGTVVSNGGPTWPEGAFGPGTYALPASDFSAGKSTYCDTGWDGGLVGSLTFGWFMVQRSALGAQAMTVFGGPGSLRCFTGGAAGNDLLLEGWGGPTLRLADVQALAANAWVHVAVVIDVRGMQSTARWYVNGQPRPPQAIPGGASIAASSPVALRIGSATNPYDLDEFRLVAAAMGPPVIQGWASASGAAATSLGTSCGAVLRHRGGAPSGGNSQFGLTVEGEAGRPCALFVGPSQLPVPLDLGTVFNNLQGMGCLLYGGLALSIPGVSDANGLAHYAIPIPNPAPAAVLYSQAVVLGSGGLALANAHAAALR